MPGSLRVRLPALFLLGIVLAGVVAALIAVQLFQGYTRSTSFEELGREARGIARLYGDAALRATDEGASAPDFAPDALELATGDQLFYVGAPAFPGQESGLQRLTESSLPQGVSNRPMRFEFKPPGQNRTYLAASQPVRLERGGPGAGFGVAAGRGAHGLAVGVVLEQWRHAVQPCVGGGFRHHVPGAAVEDVLARPTEGADEHRKAAGLGLEHDVAGRVGLAGKHEHIRGRVGLGELTPVQHACEHRVRHLRPKLLLHRTAADDHEPMRDAALAERLRQRREQVQPFLPGDPADVGERGPVG